MKKFLALVMAMMMMVCSFTALAEETADIDMSDWSGVSLTDLGMEFYCPADMQTIEMTDEDYANGLAYAAKGENLSLVIALYSQEEQDLAGVEAELAANEAYKYGVVELNGANVIAFETTTADGQLVDGVVFAGVDGYMYQFMFYLTDEASQALASAIMNTLQPATEE